MNEDRVTFSFLMCFVKCTCSAKLTCNRSANTLVVVAHIVLCAVSQPAALVIVALHVDLCVSSSRRSGLVRVTLFPHSGGPQEGSAAQKRPHCTRRLLTLWSVGLSDCGFVCLHI